MQGELFDTIVRVGVYFVPFLFSLCVHEYAHGWVARLKGDNTAQMMGRLTLNPSAHADMIGTYVLPIASILMASPIFFGWAKPVPINTRNLKNPRTDMFWIASAGPLSNLAMAIIGAFAYVLATRFTTGLGQAETGQGVFGVFIYLNLFLATFNLLPVHPLDGGKVLARFIPPAWDRKLEENQTMISILLMVLFISGAMRFLIVPIYYAANMFIYWARLVL